MKNIVLSIVFIVTLFSFHARAAENACYNDSAYAAEQMVRFHSQLMIIGMMCRPYDTGEVDSYQQYLDFSKRHEELIRQYEQRLVNYYQDKKQKRPERVLHNMRTQIANDLSRYAMRMSPQKFCNFFQNRLDQALAMSEKDLNALVNTVTEAQISSIPLCTKNF